MTMIQKKLLPLLLMAGLAGLGFWPGSGQAAPIVGNAPHRADGTVITAHQRTPKRQPASAPTPARQPVSVKTTPAKPATTAAKPAVTKTKPAVAEAKPATTVAKPAATTAKPATTTATPAKPATTAAKPATTTAKPAVTPTKPATPVAKPAATTAKPATTVAKPAATTAKPATTAAKPAAIPAKPATPVAKPAATASKPAAAPAKPATTAAKPAATPAKPAATPAKPTTTAAKPAAKPARPVRWEKQQQAKPQQKKAVLKDLYQVGDHAWMVKMAQSYLEDLGYDPGTTNGDFTKATRKALKKFQKKENGEGLRRDGKLDMETYQCLKRKSAEKKYGKEYGSADSRAILATAARYRGTRYVFGGTSPSGFDCSGYVQYVFARHGIQLTRTADTQAKEGVFVSRAKLQPGDLVFFSTYAKGASHDGIYAGNGKFWNATSHGVMLSDMNDSYWSPRYYTARRILGKHK